MSSPVPQGPRTSALHVEPGHASEPKSHALDLRLSLDSNTLLASLSDGGGVMLVGETPNATELLGQWQRVWDCAEPAEQMADIGAQMLEALIPPRIRRHLADAPYGSLRLGLHPSLALVPWAHLNDGRDAWQRAFRLSYAFLGKDQTRATTKPESLRPGPLKLLLCAAGRIGHARDASMDSIVRTLKGLTGLAMQEFTLDELREAPTDALAEFDIVHMLGSLPQILDSIEQHWALRNQLSTSKLIVLDCRWTSEVPHPWSSTGQQLAQLCAGPLAVCLVGASCPATKLLPEHIELSALYRDLSEGQTVEQAASAGMIVFGGATLRLAQQPAPMMAERSFRQVTALSYDLVGSTELMRRLGAEAYSLALQNIHQRFAEVVGHWGGVSDAHQGDDGVMCYFGVHQSDETTVRSALFAAQDLVAQAKHLDAQVRIGVATGMVAVSDNHYVGLSVHLAARILGLAQAGDIMVSASTTSLAQGAFALTPVAQHERFKGFPEAASVFKLDQSMHVQRWSQWSAPTSERLIGRDAEQQTLLEHWHSACTGRSIWLHLFGEAGIGKSRLMAAVAKRLEERQTAQTFVCRCLPETSTRAFAPIIGLLEYWFKIDAGDSIAQRHATLAAAASAGTINDSDLQAVSHLLGLDMPRYGLSREQLAEPNRRLILRNMVRWMLDVIRQQPVCLVIEDLQWVDPSTVEFLTQLKAQSQRFNLLVVLTERQDTAPPQLHPLSDVQMGLDRLSNEAVREMIQVLSEGKALPRGLARAIEEKSDGIPLFVEMSARMAVESESTDAPNRMRPIGDFQVPATVRDLLMQRLDSLGPARQLAQLCSAIGREFSLELLEAVAATEGSGLDIGRARLQLVELMRGGLIVTSRLPSNSPQFWFRHALIQDVAYQSMWETDRRSLHRLIASTMQARFPELVAAQPEVLARHHAASGAEQEALRWHMLAAKKFKRREAFAEALVHLDAAQAQLGHQTASTAHTALELEIELTRAGPLVVTRGYGAESVGACFQRALSLSRSLDDKKSLLRAQLGIEAYHFVRGDFGQAHAYIAQAQATAAPFQDALTMAMCQWAVANILFHQGEVRTALTKMDECVATCRTSGLSAPLAQSPDVMSLIYASFSLWELGLADQAMRRADEAVELAHSRGQRLGTGQALGMRAMVQLVCGNADSARDTSVRAVTHCEAGDHEMWTAHARFIQGCALAELGDIEQGLAMMDAADALWASTGAILTRSFYLATRARWYGRIGQAAHATELIDQAWAIVTRYGERYFAPEVLRLKGELLRTASTPTSIGSEQGIFNRSRDLFEQAIDAAQAQELKALELRARTSLVELTLADPRRRDTALPTDASGLQKLLAQLEEGFGTRDVRLAKQVLARAAQYLQLP